MKSLINISLLSLFISISLYARGNQLDVLCNKDRYSNSKCLTNSYEIIEAEKYYRSRHNWMKVGDTLDTDIITDGVGSEKRRNLPREAYIFPTSSCYQVSSYKIYSKKYLRYYQDQNPRVVKSGCDTPKECKY